MSEKKLRDSLISLLENAKKIGLEELHRKGQTDDINLLKGSDVIAFGLYKISTSEESNPKTKLTALLEMKDIIYGKTPDKVEGEISINFNAEVKKIPVFSVQDLKDVQGIKNVIREEEEQLAHEVPLLPPLEEEVEEEEEIVVREKINERKITASWGE